MPHSSSVFAILGDPGAVSRVDKMFVVKVHCKIETSPWALTGRDPFNQNTDRSDRKKRTTSKGGPVFSKLFRLDRTDPLSFGPKFPEILVEWIAPTLTEPVPEAFELPASDWPEKIFSGQSAKRSCRVTLVFSYKT